MINAFDKILRSASMKVGKISGISAMLGLSDVKVKFLAPMALTGVLCAIFAVPLLE